MVTVPLSRVGKGYLAGNPDCLQLTFLHSRENFSANDLVVKDQHRNIFAWCRRIRGGFILTDCIAS